MAGEYNLRCPQLCYQYTYKRNMKALDKDVKNWELAMDRSKWRNNLHATLQLGEEKLTTASDDRHK